MNETIRTTAELVRHHAVAHAQTPCLGFYGAEVTYGELHRRTDAVASFLAERGVGRGDAVALMMGNSPAFFYVVLGAQKLGAVAVPISCWWQGPEIEYLIGDCRPPFLFVDPEYWPTVRDLRSRLSSVRCLVINDTEPGETAGADQRMTDVLATEPTTLPEGPAADDLAALLYTSGTTGKPKGVMLTHHGIIRGAQIKTGHVPVEAGERVLCVLPLFHSGGLNDLAYPSLLAGATIILRRGFSASEFWACVEEYRISAFYIVPTMWNILLRVPESRSVDTSSLRFGLSGAAPIPPEQLQECEDRFGIPVLEAYGLTENTGGITANQLDRRRVGSVGVVMGGLDLAIVDEQGQPCPTGTTGEIAVRGDTVMRGYRGAAETTAETIRQGWLHTGDLGYRDDDGFLFLVDRKKDLIIRGGVNVYPGEIEKVIATHPAVVSVAVIPESHDKYGQVAMACVVALPDQTLAEAELRRYCAERLAAYKVPEHFLFRESLPANAVGKVRKYFHPIGKS